MSKHIKPHDPMTDASNGVLYPCGDCKWRHCSDCKKWIKWYKSKWADIQIAAGVRKEADRWLLA